MTARPAKRLDEGVVRPFVGQLITPLWAPRVVAPMLDTLATVDQSQLLATQQTSWLHVAAPPAPEGVDAPLRGSAALRHLVDAGAYADVPPGLFVYRIEDEQRSSSGIVAGIDAAAFVDGRARGHEAVQPDRVEAVLQTFARVSARSELVALIHANRPDIEAAVAAASARKPLLDFRSADGTQQKVWRLADELVDVMTGLLALAPLYVADGHHRVAASLHNWQRAGRPAGTTVPAVVYPPDELRLEAFHRRVRGPVDGPALLHALQSRFDVQATGRATPMPGAPTTYIDGGWYVVRLPSDNPPGVAGLDVVRVHTELLEPLLGVSAVSDPRLEATPSSEPLAGIVARCDRDGGVLFALAPPALAQLIEVADRGEVMMAKSTFFEPKPQAGLFLHHTGV